MDRSDLQQLSKEQLIELVLRLQRPDKNSHTSSKPPSTDKKEKRENSRPGGAKLGHEPHNRRLADNPDEFRDHMPSVCEQCGGAFSTDADRELIGDFLKGKYKGYVSADAHNIYDHLFLDGTMVELGCWAHARRNFYDAKDSDPDRAHLVLARIRRLYDIEKDAKEEIEQGELSGTQADAVRLQHRQTRSLLEVRQLRAWLEAEKDKVLPKSLIGQAIAYALKNWTALTRYLDDGRLAIDNNVAERALRHIAIGRKNWMFAGSASGADTAAILFSVSSSCHRHGVDVFAYVRDLLERLAHDPTPSPEVLRDWLPDRWKPPSTPPPGSVLTGIGPAAGEPTDNPPTVDASVGNPA